MVDSSDAPFSIVPGSAALKVTTPNTTLDWGHGSTQKIAWTHNLGSSSYVRIELSRDGGATYPEIVAPSVKNAKATSGEFIWKVTTPNTAGARVRVRWAQGEVSDASDTSFTISDPYIAVKSPKSGMSWGYGTMQRIGWSTNLGALDRVGIELSTDGGQSYPLTLASEVAATRKYADGLTPALSTPITAARVRVLWTNAPAGLSAAAVNPAAFRIEPAFVTVVAPTGGETWSSGNGATIRWTSNLGNLEAVAIVLSIDGGQSFSTTLLANTPSDGGQSVTVQHAWITEAGRVKIDWLKNPAVTDISDAVFAVR
jgi:hypothetical protein